MKKSKRSLTLLALIGAISFLGACSDGGGSDTSSGDPSSTGTETSSPAGTVTEEKNLVAAFTSPADLAYSNFRPTYNYYLTTFSFETLELYDDDTYALTYSSSTFSGIVLPEDSSDGAANERDNVIEIYYGTYSSEVNDLDEDSLDITLSVPYRLVENHDSTYFIDTARWDSTMSEAVSTDEVTHTAETYLASRAFHEKTILASSVNYSFDFFELRGSEESDPEVTVSTDTGGLVAAYQSPSSFYYINQRPAYNYYITYFVQQQILLYEDGTYSFDIYSSQFSGLSLPEEGDDIVGNERINYTQKFAGEYSSEPNDLDETLSDLTLEAPTSTMIAFDSSYYLDTENWTDEMSENSSSSSGEEYLESVAFDETEVILTETTNSFSYIEDLVTPILI